MRACLLPVLRKTQPAADAPPAIVRVQRGAKPELFLSRQIGHCFDCTEPCRNGLLRKIKPYAFTEFARRFGEKHLLDCLERNEKNGVVYHRAGVQGDYDDFDDVEALISFIETGHR